MENLETRETEDRLTAGLRARAGRIDPPDRFADVLEAAGSGGRGRRWLPLAAAAAVLAMVGGLWVLGSPTTGPAPTVPASSGPSAPAPSATAPTPSPAPTPSSSPTTPPPAAAVSLPVYVTSPEALDDPASGYGLRRQWLVARVVDEEEKVRTAVDASLDAPVDGLDAPPWSAVDVVSVDLAEDAVTVLLSGAPRSTGTRVDELALPQVAWTAQAVLGLGNLPVTVVADGTTLGVVTRPPAAEWWTVLTDVWITDPGTDATVPGDDVVVTGEASVFEAALVWRLERDGAVVDSGSTTASVGAPERGTWRVDLGRLDPGEYTVHVEELSAKDGSVAADDARTLRVTG